VNAASATGTDPGTRRRRQALNDALDQLRVSHHALLTAACGERDRHRSAVLDASRDRLQTIVRDLKALT
jgi:hypothetical protein